jgi:hypothetical protein
MKYFISMYGNRTKFVKIILKRRKGEISNRGGKFVQSILCACTEISI